MNNDEQTRFNKRYQQYLNELTLQGKIPKIIEMYSHYIRHIAEHLDTCPDHLSTEQLKHYFITLVEKNHGARSRLPAMPSSFSITMCWSDPGSLSSSRLKYNNKKKNEAPRLDSAGSSIYVLSFSGV